MLSSQGADCIINQQGVCRVAYMERAYGAGRSSPVEAIFSVGRHDELYEKGLLVG